jgi:FKBP-type peptidyl-prolyl cis-trans isomerase 2
MSPSVLEKQKVVHGAGSLFRGLPHALTGNQAGGKRKHPEAGSVINVWSEVLK